MLGSVNSKNFVPVNVWKHDSVKNDEERDWIPDDGTEGSGVVREPAPDGAGAEEGNFGVKDRVMAWTPWKVPARMSMSFAVRCWRGEVCVCGVDDAEFPAGALGALCGRMKLRW
jgi:hypothetical protein